MTKRKLWIGGLGCGLCVAVLLSAQLAKSPAGSDDEAVSASRVVVETATLQPATDSATTRTFSGLIKATRTSEIGFKRSGRVEAIAVQTGQRVRAGELLARLDVQQSLADLEQARASLQAAEAQLAEAIAGPRAETIAAARAQVADSDAEVKLWTARVARHQDLLVSRAVSAQEYDDSRFQLEAAVSRRDRVQRQLDELLAGTRTEQIAVFRAGVAQWSASVKRLEVEVEDSDLRAPYDSLISHRYFDEGVVVPPGVAILRLVEHQSVEAWIGLPSTAIARLQDTSIHALQVEGETFWATVRDVLPEVDLATRTRTVVLTVTPTAERPQLPTPGQMVRLSLLHNNEQPGYWVPTTALSRGQRGLWALLVVSPDDHTLQKRDVELMQVDSDRTLVRGLIEAGEHYVTTGLHRLTPGQQVQVVNR